jgi:hypothetical protein
MKGLKIILWICALCFLLEFIFVPLPWVSINAFFKWIGVEPIVAQPITVFGFRLSMALFGTIGIFFLILARNPLQYGDMLPLAAYGLICYGIIWFFGAMRYGLPVWAYFCDVILGLVGGLLILFFRKKVI